jgi:hypothetical protein
MIARLDRRHAHPRCCSRLRLPIGLAGLIVVSGAFACRTTAAPTACPSLLSQELSPAERELGDRLPKGETSASPDDRPRFIAAFEDIGLSDSQWHLLKEKWKGFLATRRNSSIELEEEAASRLRRRYLEAAAQYEQALTTCKRTAPYDGTWAEALRREFGDTLKRHAAALRHAVGLAYFRAERRCTAAARAELLEAEIDYQTGFEDELRDFLDAVTSANALSADKTAAIIQRAETYTSLQRKRGAAWRMIPDGRDLALLEAEAGRLPPDLASALARQSALLKPFKLTRAVEDLNRMLQ